MKNDFEIEGDVIKIPISSDKLGNHIVLADLEDRYLLSPHRWYLDKNRTMTYCKSSTGGRMHRKIASCPLDMVVDHINRNTLDNRKVNLRICSVAQNSFNRVGNRDGYRGIHIEKRGTTWKYRAQLKTGSISYFSEPFLTEIEAAIAYNGLAQKHFGEFALLNQINMTEGIGEELLT